MVAWSTAWTLAFATGSPEGSRIVPNSSALPAWARQEAVRISRAAMNRMAAMHDSVAHMRKRGGAGTGGWARGVRDSRMPVGALGRWSRVERRRILGPRLDGATGR